MTERPLPQVNFETKEDKQESVISKTKTQLTELDSRIAPNKITTTTQTNKNPKKKGLSAQEESKNLKNKSISKDEITQATQQPILEKKSEQENIPKAQNLLDSPPPNIPDFSVLPKGKLGIPLLSRGNLVQKNNQTYDITVASYYSYKTKNDLHGKDYENHKKQGILIDNGEGKVYILGEESLVITENEVIKQLGPPRHLQNNIYIGADNIKRKTSGGEYYTIKAINSCHIRDAINKYGKENIGLFREEGVLILYFGFKEEKEIPESTIEHFDATDIREWGDGKGKLSFYSKSDLGDSYEDRDNGVFFEGGINTEKFGKIPPSQLLIVIKKDAAGKKVKNIYKKPNRKIILGDASLYQDIPNSQQIAQSLMDDDIDGGVDYSKISQRMHYIAQEMKKEYESEEGIIWVVHQYVKERLSYSPDVHEYYIQLSKFERGETKEKPKKLHVLPKDNSGLETFSNRIGVCGGYAETALLLLSFAGIKDVKVITGIAPSEDDLARKGPNGWSKEQQDDRWHAWLKIKNKHYDVTWDDKEDAVSAENDWFGASDEFMKQKGREWTE